MNFDKKQTRIINRRTQEILSEDIERIMTIIYDSLTGLCKSFAESLGYPCIDINDEQALNYEETYFLVTRCVNFGQVTEEAALFLNKHHKQVIGVACGGNRNWGENYAVAGDKIEKVCGIPCVVKFEAMGFPHEREIAKSFISDYVNSAE